MLEAFAGGFIRPPVTIEAALAERQIYLANELHASAQAELTNVRIAIVGSVLTAAAYRIGHEAGQQVATAFGMLATSALIEATRLSRTVRSLEYRIANDLPQDISGASTQPEGITDFFLDSVFPEASFESYESPRPLRDCFRRPMRP